jgi:UDP-4-amino-4,6-dideoxy-N-acetyl-beta-L-altrosamine N-acetyltransferase
MRISHGNMVLRSLEKEDLELVRNWRNDQLVNEHLLNREHISKEAQLEWFRATETDNCLYLIIEEKSQPVGLIYASQIKIKQRSFCGNIMMGHQIQKDSWASVKAVLLLCDLMLVRCDFELIYSVVNKNNKPALAMNRRLGFIPYKETDGLSYESCEFKNHYGKTERIRAVLLASTKTVFTFNEGDKNLLFLSHLSTNN